MPAPLASCRAEGCPAMGMGMAGVGAAVSWDAAWLSERGRQPGPGPHDPARAPAAEVVPGRRRTAIGLKKSGRRGLVAPDARRYFPAPPQGGSAKSA